MAGLQDFCVFLVALVFRASGLGLEDLVFLGFASLACLKAPASFAEAFVI